MLTFQKNFALRNLRHWLIESDQPAGGAEVAGGACVPPAPPGRPIGLPAGAPVAGGATLGAAFCGRASPFGFDRV